MHKGKASSHAFVQKRSTKCAYSPSRFTKVESLFKGKIFLACHCTLIKKNMTRNTCLVRYPKLILVNIVDTAAVGAVAASRMLLCHLLRTDTDGSPLAIWLQVNTLLQNINIAPVGKPTGNARPPRFGNRDKKNTFFTNRDKRGCQRHVPGAPFSQFFFYFNYTFTFQLNLYIGIQCVRSPLIYTYI